MTALEITQAFLDLVFSGNMEAALAMVAEDARFIATNPNPNPLNPMHGTFEGPQGAADFFAAFGALLEPVTFDIEGSFTEDGHAALFGTLEHTVRETGKPFASDWALITAVNDGKITFYHFYEDTAALEAAMQQ